MHSQLVVFAQVLGAAPIRANHTVDSTIHPNVASEAILVRNFMQRWGLTFEPVGENRIGHKLTFVCAHVDVLTNLSRKTFAALIIGGRAEPNFARIDNRAGRLWLMGSSTNAAVVGKRAQFGIFVKDISTIIIKRGVLGSGEQGTGNRTRSRRAMDICRFGAGEIVKYRVSNKALLTSCRNPIP